MLKTLRQRRARRAAAARLFAVVAERGRAPFFYEDLAVPDSLDGRFDLFVLHAWLVLDWLRAASATDLAQAFIDTVFVELDEALRELGVGDMGMGRRMKTMAGAFYGRMDAYARAQGEKALAEAIVRNLYRGSLERVESAEALARYCVKARAQLERGNPLQGEADFGALPTVGR